MKSIVIGQILKPQGIRGEVKVKALTDDPSRFCVLKSVFISGKPYKILSCRVAGDSVNLCLDGVADRNAAESLRSKFLEIDRAAAVTLDIGEFFIDDLIGAKLYKRNLNAVDYVGTVKRVDSFGAADVFTVALENSEMSFAFVKELNAEYDAQKNELYVDGKKFDEVAVYED